MAIKFTDLTAVQTLTANDVFAVAVSATGNSAKINFSDLKSIVVDASTFANNAGNMVSALNAYDSGNGTNLLNADKLDGQQGSYYLEYSNLQNTPTIPTDLHDLNNAQVEAGGIGGFIRLRPSDSKLIFQKKENGALTSVPVIITTSNIEEGLNKFYTDDRVETYFDGNFAAYFNKYNITFDEGNVIDSYFDTVGYAPIVSQSNETNVIRIKTEGQIPGTSADFPKRDQTGRFLSYQPGTNIRLFGADSSNAATPITNQADFSIVVEGFNTYADSNFSGGVPTFDATTGIANNTITFASPHGFDNYDAVIYASGGAGAVIGLEEGKTYYIYNPSNNANSVQLVDVLNGTIAKTFDVGSGNSHTLTPVQISTPFQRITYSICEWDMSTGKISAPTGEQSVNVGTPVAPALTDQERLTYLSENQNRILESFSVENFVKLQLTHNSEGSVTSGITPGKGLCVYRRVAQVNTIAEQLKGEPKLVAVVGPLDMKNDTWIDYYTDDVLTHSGKNQIDNSYLPENTVHFKPFQVPLASVGARGWVDATIESIEYQNEVNPTLSTYIDLTLQGNVIMDSGETNGVWISHNDTAKIQTAITANSDSGRKAIQFNPKTYIVTQLVVPDNFSIAGYAYNTKLTKLPWSGWTGSGATSSTTILKSADQSLRNTSFVGFDIDGNSINSIGFDDTSNITLNYAVDVGQFSDSVLFDKVRIRKPIGGGIYAPDPTNLKVIGCEALDSGITDRHVFSPLIASGGIVTSISSNRFENFSKGAIDISLTDKGSVEGNIISNCGSGLIVFGSKFMISSPNVLTGPAGEFLPAPDIYNSEYDLINIDLTSVSLSSSGPSSFDSDFHKYQENGEVYDFGASLPEYKIFAIKKTASGEESIWIEDLTAPTGTSQEIVVATFDATDDTVYDFVNNNITVTVPAGIVNGLATGDPVVYNKGLDSNQDGAVSPSPDLVDGTTYFVSIPIPATPNVIRLYTDRVGALSADPAKEVTFTNAAGPQQNGATGSQHTLTRNAFLGIVNRYESGNLPSEGGFQWTIPSDTVRKIKFSGQPYTADYLKNPNNTIYYNNGGTFAMTTGDPDHIGIGWSATITAPVDAAIIVNNAGNPGTWTQPGGPGTPVYYTITVRDYKYLGLGRKVRPKDLGVSQHLNFSTGVDPSPGATAPDEFGIITDISDGTEQKIIQIEWPNAYFNNTPDSGGAVGGSGGILEVEDTFVIATGRIK